VTNYTMCPDDPSIKWEIIPGWDGRYEASDTGLIRRAIATRSMPEHSLLSQAISGDGYPVVGLISSKRRVSRAVHRLVMLAFRGECPKGHEVNHIDGNKSNNHLSNLEYVTHAHNIRHALNIIKSPFGQKGTAHNLAKLDDEKIREIRKIASVGISTRRIAQLYGVTQPLISGILNGRYWSHVKD